METNPNTTEVLNDIVVEEQIRQYRYRAFDKMIDLALAGVITRDEAIEGFKEQCAEEDLENEN